MYIFFVILNCMYFFFFFIIFNFFLLHGYFFSLLYAHACYAQKKNMRSKIKEKRIKMLLNMVTSVFLRDV